MSFVKSFIDVSQASSPRGTPFPVHAQPEAGAHARWSRTRSDVPLCASKPTEKSAVSVSSPCDEQIRAALTGYFRLIGQTPSRASLKGRVQVISSFYKDLRASGYDIDDVTKFSLRHAKALLLIWQIKKCAPNTLYVRWSVIRSWTRVLNKHGMVGPLADFITGFNREADSEKGYRSFSPDEIAARSAFLHSKPDRTHYLVDRITRELNVTRERAFELELDAVQAVLSGTSSLRVGMGAHEIHLPHAQDHLKLLIEAREFMLARNRKTLAWTDFDLNAAIQKYALRMSYVNRTIFPKMAGGAT